MKKVGLFIRDDYYRKSGFLAKEIIEAAVLAEKHGFDSVWLNEDIGRDALTLLGAIALRTSKVSLGTAIVNVYARSPTQIAMGFATLDEISGGRAIIGLGVGHEKSVQLGHGIPLKKPIERTREYVEIIKRVISGAEYAFNGHFFQGMKSRLIFSHPREYIPIYIAGHQPRMIQLASEVADGLIVNVVPPNYLRKEVLEQLRVGAERAGRDVKELDVACVISCCVSNERNVALKWAKELLVKRYLWNPSVCKVLSCSGFEEEVASVKALLSAGREEEAVEAIDEKMVKEVINSGTPSEVKNRLDEYWSAGAKTLLLAAYPGSITTVKALIDSVYPLKA